MDVRWGELRDEAKALAKDMGTSGRGHHSLARVGPLLDAIRQQGVPEAHREWVWPILLHAHRQTLQRQSSNFATYHQLLEHVAEDEEAAASAATGGATEEEVVDETTTTTTSPSLDRRGLQEAHEMAMERFSHLNPFQERKIKRILLAYIKSKEAFYYCHGMVEICVVLSTFLSEEDAFWAFRLLLEVLLPKYHEASIIDFQVDCLVLQELLERQDPQLAEHLAAVGVTIQVLCTKWFFSFFAESMPFEVVCRLYDILLVDIASHRVSSKIIFSTAAAVFLYLSDMLLEIQDPSIIVELMCEFSLTTLSEHSVAETFVDLILFLHELISDDDVQGLRVKYKQQLEHEERLRNPHANHANSVHAAATNPNTPTLRRGKSQSIKLLIQWKQVHDEAPASASALELPNGGEEDGTEEIQLELVATPTEKEVLAKLHQGIDRINRRRSRTSSVRSIQLLGSGLTGLSPRASPYASCNVSLSGSLRSNSTLLSPRESEELAFFGGGSEDAPDGRHDRISSIEDLANLWDQLRTRGDSAAVASRSCHGVPDEHRHWVWPTLLARAPLPKRFPKTFPTSENACDAPDHVEPLEPEVEKAIENDIIRTRNLQEAQYPPMRRVLQAFARRNRRVGYCQGMNEILAVLLQYLSERDALLGLVLLIETVLPAYHVDSMIGLHTDCAVMNTLLRQNDPELHAHIINMGLNMEILCTKWLVTCFLTSLPAYCGLQIMDMLLARVTEHRTGSRVLLGVGLSVLFSLRTELLAARDAGEVLMAINEYFAEEMNKTDSDMELFLAFCRHVIDQLQPEIVEEFRLIHKDEVMERFATFEAKKIEMRQQMEASKHRQSSRAGSEVPGSPPKSDHDGRHSGGSSAKKHSTGGPVGSSGTGLSSYIGKPSLLGSSRVEDRESGYQRVDVIEANRSYAEELSRMDEQLEDLAELFVRGKIDDKEHACIKAQIVRKWCKGMNSPQSAMIRVQSVKAAFGSSPTRRRRVIGLRRGGGDPGDPLHHHAVSGSGGSGLLSSSSSSSQTSPSVRPRKSSASSLYGKMKKVKKNAIAIFKATFE